MLSDFQSNEDKEIIITGIEKKILEVMSNEPERALLMLEITYLFTLNSDRTFRLMLNLQKEAKKTSQYLFFTVFSFQSFKPEQIKQLKTDKNFSFIGF